MAPKSPIPASILSGDSPKPVASEQNGRLGRVFIGSQASAVNPRPAGGDVEGLHDEAMQAAAEGRFATAEGALAELVSVAESRKWTAWEALGWALLGELHGSRGHLTDASEAYSTALELTERAPEAPAELAYKCLNNLGCLLKQSDRFAESESYFVRSVNELEERTPSRWLHRAMLYNNLGALYHAAGYFSEALEMHERGLEHTGQLHTPPPRLLAELHRNAGLARLFSTEAKSALDHFQKARHQITQIGHVEKEASEQLIELGLAEASAWQGLRDWTPAEKALLEAISLCQQTSGRAPAMLPTLYTNLGCLYAQAGLPEAARDLFEDAHLMRLSNLATPESLLAQSHWNLAVVCEWLEESRESARHLHRCLALDSRKYGRLPAKPTSGWRSSGSLILAQHLSPSELQAITPPVAKSLGSLPPGMGQLRRKAVQ